MLVISAFLISGIVIFNYFAGDEHQRAHSEEILGSALELGERGFTFVGNELGKIRRGEYDEKLEAMNQKFQTLRQGIAKHGPSMDEVDQWLEDYRIWQQAKSKWDAVTTPSEELTRQERQALIDFDAQAQALAARAEALNLRNTSKTE